MKRYLLGVIALILVASALLLHLSSSQDDSVVVSASNSSDHPIRVATSFYILEEITRNLGGDSIEVTASPSSGVEAHSFEPTAKNVEQLLSADLFLFMGAGFDTWAKDLEQELIREGVSVIEMANTIDLLTTEVGGDLVPDPHVWLDPLLMVEMVNEITDQLSVLDPDNRTTYQERAQIYIDQLTALDSEFTSGLSTCELHEIIVAHDAFTYLGERYGIKINAIAGLSPESSPGARRLGELSQLAEERGIRFIFFEELTSPRLSETLAQEIGASTLVLNPIEGLTTTQREGGENYISIMRSNLDNLHTALLCEG